MNRAQRRQAAKNNGINFRKAAHATDASIEKRLIQADQEAHKQAQNYFMGLMYCTFVLVLRKILKFGPVRTLRVLSEVAAIINDLNDGVINVFDLKRDTEEAGIRIVFDTDYNIIETGIFEEDKHEWARKRVDDERMRLYEEFNHDGLRLWSHPEWSDKYVTH